MGKRLFWIFLFVVSLATAAGVLYIQSEAFARIVKRRIQEKMASTGVDLNFERVKIGVLPPSVSLLNVDLKVLRSNNRFGLAEDTVFTAGSMGFSFPMIQAFSSGIAVNKVFVSDASVKLRIPKSTGPSVGESEKLSALVHKPLRIQLTNNFFATIRQLEWRNTSLDLTWDESGQDSRFFAKSIGYLAITPSREGTNFVWNADEISLTTPKVKESLKAIKVNADIQKNQVQIANLDAQRREAALHASGKLLGSIDNLAESKAELSLILRGPFTELADFDKKLESLGGEVLADLKVSGRLRDPGVQGKLEVREFAYGLWHLDKLDVSGSYQPGMAVVDSLNIHNGPGRIFLRNKVELPIPFKAEPANVVLGLENANFDEFAGDLKKAVNSLKMQLDGTIHARLDFTESAGTVKLGGFLLKPELSVKDLELNNQAFNKIRSYKRIFKVKPFQLNGNVQLKNGEVSVSATKMAFATGSLDVSGSVGKDGFNLTGKSENVNLGAEAGEISGIPLQGEGAITLHVHGPGDRVKIDFDVKQKNAKFVNFDFGTLEGRVTFDDDKDFIFITGVHGTHGTAAYKVDGGVDLGKSDNISLNAEFSDSAPDDVFAIFAHQLRTISWIPHGMAGTIRGKVKVGGKYTDGLSTLEIDSQLSGRNLFYQGETVHELEAHAGVSKGVAFAHDVRAKKYETPFTGSVDFDTRTSELRYNIDAQKGKLRSLDFLGSSGIPVDGLYALHSEGKGKWEELVSKSRFDITSGFVRTRALPPVSLAYDTTAENSSFLVKVGPNASLTGQISQNPKGDSHAHLSLAKADFDFLLCMLSRTNCSDGALNFTVSADAKLSWKGWDWKTMNGAGALQELQVAKTGYSLRVDSPVPVGLANGMADSGQGTLVGEESRIAFRFKGRVDGTAIDNSIHGTGSLKLLEFLTPLVEEARGRLRLDIGLKGDVRNGTLRGSANIEEGMLRVRGLDAPVDNLEARFNFADSQVSIDSLTGQLGGGTVQASGGMDLYLNRPPHFAVDLFLANNRIKFPFVNYAEISDAKLSFTGDSPPYLFSGTARAKKVMMHNNFDISSGQKGLQNARYLPEKVAGIKSFYEVRIRGLADGGIFVENNLLNAEFRGEITLMNNFEFPQIVGRAELVRGKLQIRNTTFALDHASIRVPNQEVFNPQFSVGGVANVDVYRINIFAAGTIDHPKVTLSSNPALPQEDIASLVAFGYRGEDTRKVSTNDNSAVTYSEVSSILLEQLQLSQSLQSKGIQMKVLPALNESEANIIRPNSAATAAPKVSAQVQVMKNLEAAFGGTVGASQGQNLDAKLEYRLTRKASVSAIYEQSPSGLDATETKNSYGADLKFRWGFK